MAAETGIQNLNEDDIEAQILLKLIQEGIKRSANKSC